MEGEGVSRQKEEEEEVRGPGLGFGDVARLLSSFSSSSNLH